MIRYIFARLLQLVPTLFGVLVLTFILFDVVGGSPAMIVLGKNASAEALAEYDYRHGYDRPLLWGRSTRLADLSVKKLPKSGGELALRLPYRLFPGDYELRLRGPEPASSGTLALRLDDPAPASGGASITLPGDDVTVVPPRRGRGAFRFTVPEGRRAVALVIHPSDPPVAAGNFTPQIVTVSLHRRFANPFASQFMLYMGRFLRGDLGESIEYRQPVATILREGVGVSLALTVPILLIGTTLSLLLGLLCAAGRGGWFDRATLLITTGLMSVNYVIWVVAGQYLLAYRWRLFPLWGFESWLYLALPVLIGVISGLARDVRFYRTVMLDEVGRPHVRTALAKGLSPARVLWRHVLRNSLVPVATNVSLAIPFLFTGSILLESFFGLPGLGGVGLNAVHSSDVAMVRAVVLVGALLYQVANLLADLAYAWFDPRVRIG